jgi:hypothetical protein
VNADVLSLSWPGQRTERVFPLVDAANNLNTEDIVQMAEQLGYIDEELKKLRKK